ncbi:MAG TPA: twin-arginine translocation signal domain-containing protein [Burkholderiaceae bacterium]|nr:twin-arginine translocation signal domain-containing protein [Burkholderiaceae bacterium]
MDMTRRDFIKAGSAASVLLLPGISAAGNNKGTVGAPMVEADSNIEKSIKASFGGSFTVRAHTQAGGLVYADIEHFGTRYAVASADMFDWTVLRSL